MHTKSANSRVSLKTLLTLSLLCMPLTSLAAGGTLSLPKKAPFQKGTPVPDSVRAECGVETKVPASIQKAVKDKFDRVVLVNSVSKSTKGKALNLKTTGLLAPGGGSWSGPKSVTVEGTLWENGKEIGNFVARRQTTRGKGTCAMLERDIDAIAEDVAKWIGSPAKDARLGDAK